MYWKLVLKVPDLSHLGPEPDIPDKMWKSQDLNAFIFKKQSLKCWVKFIKCFFVHGEQLVDYNNGALNIANCRSEQQMSWTQ